MRQQFENVEVLEVIKGEDSDEATYEAARKLLQAKPNIAGVYNVAGGNRGLAQALAELQYAYRPVYITHELNRVTEPLLRTQQIDYLIVQDLDEMFVAPPSSCAKSLAMIAGPTPSSRFLSAF